MAELSKTDLHFMMSRIPKDVRELVKYHKLFIAGGILRALVAGERPSDIDLFGESKDRLHFAALDLSTRRRGRLHETDNAFTVLSSPRMPVQFIHRWTYEPGAAGAEKLLSEFDFTVCQAAIWWGEDETWRSVVSEAFYPDLAARRLVYTFPQREEDAGGSMLRVRKYLARGYTIQAGSLGGVIARLARAVKWGEVSDERFAAKVITGLLREVDPMTVVDGIDLVNEHEVEEKTE